MNKGDSPKEKQTLQNVLTGEAPTEEFLEEFRFLEEAEQLSDSDLAKQALAIKPIETEVATNTNEPDYKVKDSSFLSILIIATFTLAAYWLLTR